MNNLRILLISIPYLLVILASREVLNLNNKINTLQNKNQKLETILIAKEKAYKAQLTLCQDKEKIIDEVEDTFRQEQEDENKTIHFLAAEKNVWTKRLKSVVCKYCWKGERDVKANSNGCYFDGNGWVLGKEKGK